MMDCCPVACQEHDPESIKTHGEPKSDPNTKSDPEPDSTTNNASEPSEATWGRVAQNGDFKKTLNVNFSLLP